MAMENAVMPVYEVNKGEGGMMGGNAWIFFLFFLLAWGGGGFGGFGGGGNAANMVNNDFLYTNLNGTLDRGFTQLAQQGYSNNKDILTSANAIGQQVANCCCEINRNVDALRNQMSQDTCAITANATANTQRILDKLCQMESNAKDLRIADLQSQLQAAQLQLGNVAQTQHILSAVRPYPVPAYNVASPYCPATTGTTTATT